MQKIQPRMESNETKAMLDRHGKSEDLFCVRASLTHETTHYVCEKDTKALNTEVETKEIHSR